MLSNDIVQSEIWMGIREIGYRQRDGDIVNLLEDTGVLCLHCNRVIHGVQDNFLCECGWINDLTQLTHIENLPTKQTGGIIQISYMPIFEDDMDTLSMDQYDDEKERIQSLFLDLAQKNVMIESQESKKSRYYFLASEQLLR